jgi:hypothetical protein
VQQVVDVFQCFDGSLNAYLDNCLKIIALFDEFTMQHISRDKNTVMNDLAQQTSGFRLNRRKLSFLEKPNVPVCQTGCSDFRSMHSTSICFVEPSSAKPDGSVSETGGFRISRNSDESSEATTTDPDD